MSQLFKSVYENKRIYKHSNQYIFKKHKKNNNTKYKQYILKNINNNLRKISLDDEIDNIIEKIFDYLFEQEYNLKIKVIEIYNDVYLPYLDYCWLKILLDLNDYSCLDCLYNDIPKLELALNELPDVTLTKTNSLILGYITNLI